MAVDDATDVGCTVERRPVAAFRPSKPMDDCVSVGIGQVDDAAELIAGDASPVCRILHHRMTACEMSVTIPIRLVSCFNSLCFLKYNN